jgi:tryptophan halogenase
MKGLGLKEEDWMPKCNATYKSAICFKDFYKKGDPKFWFPFTGFEILEGRPINRYWLNKYFTDPDFKDRYKFYDYCYVTPAICENGSTVASLPKPLGYAYHVDSGLLGGVLKDYSKGNGVTHIVDHITKTNLDENGWITSLSRKNGDDIDGDLFIDCTGFGSYIMDKVMKEPFEEYYDSLFNDRAVAIRIKYEDKDKEMASYTKCTAISSGWVWRVPLYNRIGTGYVYSSNHLTADEAETELRQHLGEERTKDSDALHLKIRVGKHERSWVKNCVAVGLSGGFIEPLESTGLQIVQGQVDLLMQILRANGNDYSVSDVKVYNDSVTRLYELIRDFLVCHYALTSREDTPYWKDVKYETKIPDTLSNKLQIARGNMPDQEFVKIFDDSSLAGFNFNDGWMSVFVGMNHIPFDHVELRNKNIGAFDPQVVNNMAKANQRFLQLQHMKKMNISKMPSHYQWLKDKIYNGES